MTVRRLLFATLAVVLAVVLQTSLFVRLRPFDVAPALVILVVIAVSRQLAAERALLLGFAAGLLQDALAATPLGLWALVTTVVAYLTVRSRDRFEDDWTVLAIAVVVLTLLALVLYTVVGTIFGQKTLADAGLLKKLLVPPLYNLVLAPIVITPLSRFLGRDQARRSEWAL